MTAIEHASQILDTMLGYLGFNVRIDLVEDAEGQLLQVHTDEGSKLIGKHGSTMEDIQYLVNRVLQRHLPDAPRIRVDIDYYRAMKEERMVNDARECGERVRLTGKSETLPPLNSYHRRLIHNLFVNDPELQSISLDSNARFKRIQIRKRRS
jgi:spoIIIJ-associated protein